MDQIQQQLTDIQNRLTILERALYTHIHTGLDSQVLPQVPLKLSSAPLTAITKPTGGLTIDANARAAINTIIDDLKTLGLTL